MINSKTKLCCIIGNPVEHSLSPQMHNAAYEYLHLNYAFLAFRVTDVKSALVGLKTLGVKAISVTIPHKLEIMKYLDKIDEVATKIGAVNTIINNNGKLFGTNTDWIGALTALEEKTTLSGKKVALLGSGGAARSVAYGLIQRKAHVFVFNRTIDKAIKLKQEFDLNGASAFTDLSSISTMDIIVNTTSVGMIPDIDKSPIPLQIINSKQIVFDIVYTPNDTKLIQYAKEKKAGIVYGHKMLLYGVAKQFELFTGKEAPLDIMKNILITNLRSHGQPLLG
ncbi:shikimate dehydrogenase [Candidatus Gottesmanbacteria bacterium]|nr:shikimate dehydrogenase [Candidatus Gottesmanbacteria bacterium]